MKKKNPNQEIQLFLFKSHLVRICFIINAIIFNSHIVFGQVNLTNGLLGYWPLNGNADDISGNNRNGNLFGNVKPATNRLGNPNSAIELDGTGSYVVVPDNDGSLLPDKFSICAWFQTTSSDVQTVVGKILYSQIPINEQVQLYINWPVTPGIGSVIIPKGAPCELGHQFAESRLATGRTLCGNRWYFMVVTFEGGEHKLYLDGELKSSRLANFTEVTSCIGNLQFGAWWNGDKQFFKGFMDDIRVYNRAINPQEVSALYGEVQSTDRYDFSYQQDLCNTNLVNFYYNGPGSEISWNFEPGKNGTGRRPAHTFSKSGEFPVTMVVKYNQCATNDTLTKTLDLRIKSAKLLAFNDTTVCKNGTIQLKALVDKDFCWIPSDSLANANSSTPTVTVNQPATYYITHKNTGPNLVVNGDFAAGNTGFNSTYSYKSNNSTEGEYFISPFPKNWNSALSACQQPDGTQGNMLLVNGVPESNKVVWQQEIVVEKNTTYDFQLNITALFPINPALLQFSINNVIIGDSIQAAATTCNWRTFNTIWNSGAAERAIISIVNRNTEVQGNDFAIDNISFRKITFQMDSVVIKIGQLSLKVSPDTTVCKGSSVQLKAEGADTFLWSPSQGLNNANVANPIAVVSSEIKYFVTGKTNSGCEIVDSVSINVLAAPKIIVTKSNDVNCDVLNSNLNASGGILYTWNPVNTLSNPNIADPVAFPKVTTIYKVNITDSMGCVYSDSIQVEYSDYKKLIVTNDTSICKNEKLQLNAEGAVSYLWFPATGLSNPNIAGPEATINSNITYYIRGTTANGCEVQDSVRLGSYALPIGNALPENPLVCGGNILLLFAEGGTQYMWSPANLLDNPLISNPSAKVTGPVVFKVKITDQFGCLAHDSVVVAWKQSPVYGISPDSATICKDGEMQIRVTGGGDKFRWEPAQFVDNPENSTVLVKPVVNTNFNVTVWNNECKDSTILNSEISINPPVQSQISKSNDIDCENTSVQLFAAGGQKYRWEPSSSLHNAQIANPLATPPGTTQYFVFITDDRGCNSKDSITVFFKPSAGDQSLYQLPSAFTPNGDGLNDCFGVTRWGGGIVILSFNIYNRWGQQVFSGNSMNICWDGYFKNSRQPSGNYIYKIHATTPCGEVQRKGNFMLIR
jgi:gliding motility-associated-like protein